MPVDDDNFRPFLEAKRRQYLWKTETGIWYESRDRLQIGLSILGGNARDVMAVIDAANNSDPTQAFRSDGSEFNAQSIEIYRHLTNFLSAANALANHTRVHLQRFSKSLTADYQRQLAELMQAEAPFHLVVELRNQSQHHVLPLTEPRSTGSATGPGVFEKRASWFVPKSWLLEARGSWPAPVAVYFERDSEPRGDGTRSLLGDQFGANDVDIEWLVPTYANQAITLTEWFLDVDLELHHHELVTFVDDLSGGDL